MITFSPRKSAAPNVAAASCRWIGIDAAAGSRRAFTLVELMVSTAIIGLIMLILVAMTNQISATWRGATEKIEKFQEARDAFESMTRRLSQATLNTSWEYLDSAGKPRDTTVGTTAFNNFVPVSYGRASNLRFISAPMSPINGYTGLDPDIVRPGHGVFFQAPFGSVMGSDLPSGYGLMNNALNTWGYFVESGNDNLTRPNFINGPGTTVRTRWRSRLWEFMQPTEQMSLYDNNAGSSAPQFNYWYLNPGMTSTPRPAHVLAENILTLILLPKLSKEDQDWRAANMGANSVMLSPEYIYDSTPPNPPLPIGTPILNPGAVAGADNGAGICPKNQLPPVITVAMIAVDERSAERLDDMYPQSYDYGASAASAASVNYSGLFVNAAFLEDNPNTPDPGDGDLYQYEQILQAAKVSYRIFTSDVTVRGAKWSRAQTR